jgi:hypothetical protein
MLDSSFLRNMNPGMSAWMGMEDVSIEVVIHLNA